MDVPEQIARTSLFEDLSNEEIIDVLNIADLVTFESGQSLFKMGEDADCLYIIESGDCSVYVVGEREGRTEVCIRGPGDVVGELALLDTGPRTSDVIARSKVQAYRIDREPFDKLRRDLHPGPYKILRQIARTISGQLREMHETVSEHVLTSPRYSSKSFRPQSPLQPGRSSIPPGPVSGFWTQIKGSLKKRNST